MECPHCQGEVFATLAVAEEPPATPADVEIARIQAAAERDRLLIDRGINPANMQPLDGPTPGVETAVIYAAEAVEVAEVEASAEVAAAEALGSAVEASAEVVAAALEATAEIVAAEETESGELPDAVIVEESESSEENDSPKSLASRWGF